MSPLHCRGRWALARASWRVAGWHTGTLARRTRPSAWEFEGEADEEARAPPHLAQVEVGRGVDETDLVPDLLRQERRLRVVEDDDVLPVKPAGRVVDPGNDAVEACRAELVDERRAAALGIRGEYLA